MCSGFPFQPCRSRLRTASSLPGKTSAILRDDIAPTSVRAMCSPTVSSKNTCEALALPGQFQQPSRNSQRDKDLRAIAWDAGILRPHPLIFAVMRACVHSSIRFDPFGYAVSPLGSVWSHRNFQLWQPRDRMIGVPLDSSFHSFRQAVRRTE